MVCGNWGWGWALGLGHFTGKLSPPDAEERVKELGEAAAGHGGGEGEEEGWGPLLMYLAGMKVRRGSLEVVRLTN